MLPVLVALVVGQSSSTFRYYENGRMWWVRLSHGTMQSQSYKTGIDTDPGGSITTSVYSAKIRANGQSQRVEFTFSSGQKAFIDRQPDPANGGGTISSDQAGSYFFDIAMSPRHEYSTKVYRVSGQKVAFIGGVPGRALDVIDGRIVSAITKDKIDFFTLGNPPKRDEATGSAREIRRIYEKRALLSKSDIYRNSQPDGLPLNMGQQPTWLSIAPGGKYWFEAGYRTYVLEGKHDTTAYFGGDVILSARGVEWQWKYHAIGLRGAFFINNHTLRFFRSTPFTMGTKTLRPYSPGIYDLNLETRQCSKVTVSPLDMTKLLKLSATMYP